MLNLNPAQREYLLSKIYDLGISVNKYKYMGASGSNNFKRYLLCFLIKNINIAKLVNILKQDNSVFRYGINI